MKNSEIRSLSVEELKNKLASEKESYRKLKFAHEISPLENPMRIKFQRRLIARLHTHVRAKELIKVNQ